MYVTYLMPWANDLLAKTQININWNILKADLGSYYILCVQYKDVYQEGLENGKKYSGC